MSSHSPRLTRATFAGVVVGAAACLMFCLPARAATEKVIYDEAVGTSDLTSLLGGPAGTLYAVSLGGGAFYHGGIIQLTPPATGQGQWTAAILYSFQGRTGSHGEVLNDGAYPVPKLLKDSNGALYGATENGGHSDTGTIFRLTPPAAGHSTWTETVLFDAFDDKVNGTTPILSYCDSSGVLYGVATSGGFGNSGTAFRLAPPSAASQSWKYSLLHSFDPYHGDFADGRNPTGLTLAKDGSFYGTTNYGASNDGTVFRLTLPSGGQKLATREILFTFQSGSLPDIQGEFPPTPPIADRSVTLYGSTTSGGVGRYGTVYRLSPPISGQTTWSQSILHSFSLSDGGFLTDGVVEETGGIIYGTTHLGGSGTLCSQGCGTVFRLAPRDFGGHLTPWNMTILHTFTGVPDGIAPNSTLLPAVLRDGTFVLFGTTQYGGKSNGATDPEVDGYGTVYEIVP